MGTHLDVAQFCFWLLLPTADLATYGWAAHVVDMADKTPKESDAPFATRIDPAKEGLSSEQMHFIKQVERAQWKKKTHLLRGRNAVTGLAIGALVLGIYGYTFYSVSQEKIMDEIDEEAKRARMQGPSTGAN